MCNADMNFKELMCTVATYTLTTISLTLKNQSRDFLVDLVHQAKGRDELRKAFSMSQQLYLPVILIQNSSLPNIVT